MNTRYALVNSAATWPPRAASPMEHRGAWASAVPFPSSMPLLDSFAVLALRDGWP